MENDEPTMHSEPDAAAPVAWLEVAILTALGSGIAGTILWLLFGAH